MLCPTSCAAESERQILHSSQTPLTHLSPTWPLLLLLLLLALWPLLQSWRARSSTAA